MGCKELEMRKLIIAMTALAAIAAAPNAFSADSACKLTGAWIGYLGPTASWTAIADGISQSYGSIVITYPAMDATLFGTFQSAVRTQSMRWAIRCGSAR
jgi:hypothetical protein